MGREILPKRLWASPDKNILDEVKGLYGSNNTMAVYGITNVHGPEISYGLMPFLYLNWKGESGLAMPSLMAIVCGNKLVLKEGETPYWQIRDSTMPFCKDDFAAETLLRAYKLMTKQNQTL